MRAKNGSARNKRKKRLFRKVKGLSEVVAGCFARRRRLCSAPGCLRFATAAPRNAISASYSSSD